MVNAIVDILNALLITELCDLTSEPPTSGMCLWRVLCFNQM